MKELSIGDKVLVKCTTSMGYDEDRQRRAYRDESTKPFEAFIVGQVCSPLGEYSPGTQGSAFGDDYDPPYLAVSGTVKLWKVRKKLRSREVLVQDEDLELIAE